MSARNRWGLPRAPAWSTLAAAALSLSLAGCDASRLTGGVREELERNRTLWEDAALGSYSYAIERVCFCGVESRGPSRVSVESGVVVGRVYVDTGDPVPAQFSDLFPAVEGLFDLLQSAYEQGAHAVRVVYDVDNGVPLELFIDYIGNAADDEVGYQVTEPVQAPPLD